MEGKSLERTDRTNGNFCRVISLFRPHNAHLTSGESVLRGVRQDFYVEACVINVSFSIIFLVAPLLK